MKRPNLKKPGITATGRQWQTIEALRADGWFVLEADSTLWSEADVARVEAALQERIEVVEDQIYRARLVELEKKLKMGGSL